MPRFVLLEHDHPQRHWDLMFDTGAALRTWRLDRPLDAGQTIRTTALPDHRRLYLDYEGPVSGDRGSVRRVLAGQFEILKESPAELVLTLRSDSLVARVTIRPPHGDGVAVVSPLSDGGDG